MADSETPTGSSGTRFLFIFGCLAVVILLAAFVWQKSVQNSNEDEAADHAQASALIVDAQADGAGAAELLQQYVASGDETLLPQMQERTDAGVTTLTQALSLAGSDPNDFVGQGSAFVQAAGQIVALRQSGDIQGASNALTALATTFTEFIAAQDTFAQDQQQLAIANQDDAESAQTLASWFAIAASAIGLAMVLGGSLLIARRITRRSPAGALSS